MVTFFFFALVLGFLCFWWIKLKKKRKASFKKVKIQSTNKVLDSSNSIKAKQHSKFQEWILKYADVSSSKQLNDELKEAFDKDDWKLLYFGSSKSCRLFGGVTNF